MNKYILLPLLLIPMLLMAQTPPSPKYHDFDFWIGEWDVYKNGTDTLVGSSQIESHSFG